MNIPLQLTFRGFPRSEPLAEYVRRRAAKLSTFHDGITGCHVVVEAPHRHSHKARPYRVCIDLTVPGDELVVSRDAAQAAIHDAYAAVDAAFDAAQRLLSDSARLRRRAYHATPELR